MSWHHGRRIPSSLGSRQSWRRTSRSEPLGTDGTPRCRLSLRVVSDFRCTGDTRGLSSPLCHVVCTYVCITRREKWRERVEKGEKQKERKREIFEREDGYPVFRYYDHATTHAAVRGFALISDTSVFVSCGLFDANRSRRMIAQYRFDEYHP